MQIAKNIIILENNFPHFFADLAHLVEQHPRNVQVLGSSPGIGLQPLSGLKPSNEESGQKIASSAQQFSGKLPGMAI